MTLTEFLLARLDEDEAAARRFGPSQQAWDWADDAEPAIVTTSMVVASVEQTEWGAHIARHDPARVLAEVAAKRAIADLHLPLVAYYGLDSHGRWLPHEGEPGFWYCEACGSEDGMIHTRGPCPTLCILASVYADHPDYHDEWRPDQG